MAIGMKYLIFNVFAKVGHSPVNLLPIFVQYIPISQKFVLLPEYFYLYKHYEDHT